MKHYRPPRFRAIDPASGQTSKPFGFQLKVASRAIIEPMERGVFQSEEWALPHSEADPVMSQASGQRDAQKTEIFAYDVLYHPDHGDSDYTPLYLVYQDDRSAAWRYDQIADWADMDLAGEPNLELVDGGDICYVVGNCFEPYDTVWQRVLDIHRALGGTVEGDDEPA